MRIKLTLALCLLCPSVVLASGSVSVAETPAPPTDSLSEPSKPSGPGYFAPYPGGGISAMADSGNITAGSCTYRQVIDNPHISSTAPRATSVHGYWKRISGRCPRTSNVDTFLQAYWCDRFGCRWIVVASNSGDVRPGGGAGRRVTARETCSSSARTVGWRGFVDVDLNGVGDPPGYTSSPPVNLRCAP